MLNRVSEAICQRGNIVGQLTQFFQPPLYWQQFEELTRGLIDNIYDTQSSSIGRPGQPQDGVDVHANTRRLGRLGVQCKRLSDLDQYNNPLPGGPVTKKLIETEAESALGFRPCLDTFIIATTAKRDAASQKAAREFSEARLQKGLNCQVLLWFWDDYVAWLNAFPDLQRWYYDQVIQIRSSADQDELILRLIATAFHRPAFEDVLHSENAADFQAALSDTQKALRTGELVDRLSRHVIQKAVGGWRELTNPNWRAELKEVDLDLRTLRALLFEGLKLGTIVQHKYIMEIKDSSLERRMDDGRRRCIVRLNNVLTDAQINPL